jgi:hypothetical protein
MTFTVLGPGNFGGISDDITPELMLIRVSIPG